MTRGVRNDTSIGEFMAFDEFFSESPSVKGLGGGVDGFGDDIGFGGKVEERGDEIVDYERTL